MPSCQNLNRKRATFYFLIPSARQRSFRQVHCKRARFCRRYRTLLRDSGCVGAGDRWEYSGEYRLIVRLLARVPIHHPRRRLPLQRRDAQFGVSLTLTFFTFFLILPIVDAVGTIAKFKPWFSITFANGISQYILQNPYPTDKVFNAAAPLGPSAAAGGSQASSLVQYYPDVRLSLAVMAAYFVVAFVLSILLAQRREM